jgi:Tol biopolymer transport system component
MKRLAWLAAIAALTSPRCNQDINDRTILIAVTSQVSFSTSGEAANQECREPAVSADGRFVAFVSVATNLTSVPTNGVLQVYVRDVVEGTTEIVSVNDAGVAGNALSRAPSLSADGSRVAFQSAASNLIPGDGNGKVDVFLRRRDTKKTIRISEAEGGGDANQDCNQPMISGNGAFVVFASKANNLVSAATGLSHVFRRDVELQQTELVSVNVMGDEADGDSSQPSVSFDGSRVAFTSKADDLTDDPATTGFSNIFVRDLSGAATTRISFANNPALEPNDSCSQPSLSGDGSRVAFVSVATNLLPSDLNGPILDVYVRDVAAGPTILASRHTLGPQGTGSNSTNPVLSHSGRYVAFTSGAPNLVDGDDNSRLDVFWRDLEEGRTIRLSVNTANVEGNLDSGTDQERPALTGDGRFGYYSSTASNLVGTDINGVRDIFGRGPLY